MMILMMMVIFTPMIISTKPLNMSSFLFSSHESKVNLSQYKHFFAGDIKSIIFIYKDEEGHKIMVKEMFSLNVPLYIVNTGCNNANIFTKKQDIFFDNAKLYVLYLRNLDDKILKSSVDCLQKLLIWKNRDKLLVITNTTSIENHNTKGLKRYCLKNQVINFSFLSLNKPNTLYIYNPFKNKLTKNSNSLSFKDTVRDLNGYQITICMFQEPVSAMKINGSFHGRDGHTARAVMRMMNASYRFTTPEDGEYFGSFNATHMSGSYKDLILKKSDVGFNSRLLRPSFNKVDYTFPHEKGDLVALVPRTSEHRHLFGSMPPLIWITSAIISIAVYIYMLLARRTTRQLSNIFLVAILILIGRSTKELKTKYFRVFYMSVMVLSIFLNTMFCSHLASFLTVPEDPPTIQTLAELARSKYPIIATPSYKNKLNISLVTQLKHRLISKVNVISMKDQIDTILRCEEVVIICKIGLARLALDEGADNCYVIMEENVMPSLMTYGVSFGSPFLERFNEIILMIGESGLGEFWSRRNIGREMQKEYRQVGLTFLWEPIKVYLIGILFSVIAFVYEVVQYKYYDKKNNKALGRRAYSRDDV